MKKGKSGVAWGFSKVFFSQHPEKQRLVKY